MAGLDRPSWAAFTALADPRATWLPNLSAVPIVAAAAKASQSASSRRLRTWDLSSNLHCSIIGTCLSAHDLRRLLRKLGLGAPDATDHALHGLGVSLAPRQDAAAKLLNKTLDDRHHAAIRRFDAARDISALRAAWRGAKEAGEIPGAYWAVLTHPAADQDLVTEAFGDVHMLSHLVGAANRADIRRLAAQDREIAVLRDTVTRQQARLRADITERDARIRSLQNMLAARPGPPAVETASEVLELGRLVAELHGRLEREARRREATERRTAATETALTQERAWRETAEHVAAQLVRELALVETALAAGEAQQLRTEVPFPGTVLYVGGRSGQTALLRGAAARRGAQLLHHDAEQGVTLLPGLIGRADLVVFPVDCVSHDAALAVKRLCRQLGRPFRALRSTGLGSLLQALDAGVQATL